MRNVLVIEEQPNLRLLLTIELQDEGYRVLPAADLPKAAQWLRQEEPDLIVLDVDRRDDAGGALLDGVRSLAPATPVVVLTGPLSAANPELAACADGVVLKSSDVAPLKEAIRETLAAAAIW